MPNGFVHIELSTDDVAKAKAFYQAIFSWKLEDFPGMAYTMLDMGRGAGVGGGMQAKRMPQAPTAWLPYVEVADVKATMEKAKAAGATIILDFMAMPGMGAFGIFVDPTGAHLGIWEPTKKSKPAAKAKSKPKAKAKAKAKAKGGKKGKKRS